MALDESEWWIEAVAPRDLVAGPFTVFIAPVGTAPPDLADSEGLFDVRWELLYPGVPDRPPADLIGG